MTTRSAEALVALLRRPRGRELPGNRPARTRLSRIARQGRTFQGEGTGRCRSKTQVLWNVRRGPL
jgi:hypothetical protein